MLFTLCVVVVIAGLLLANFVSKKHNRAIVEKTIGAG
jgi:hypothetical protein